MQKRSPSLRVSLPGIEPGLQPSRGHVRIRHTPRTSIDRAPRQGVEPRLVVSKTTVLPSHSQGISLKRPDLESNQDQDLRRVLCCPLHHRVLHVAYGTRGDRWELNPYLLLHRQMCITAYTTDTIKVSAEGKGFEPSSPGGWHALAVRPGKPYPATFQKVVDRMGVEPITPILQGSVAPNGMPAHRVLSN